MTKYFVLSGVLFGALAQAFPAPADALIAALVASRDFQQSVAAHVSKETVFRSDFDQLQIEKLGTTTPEFRAKLQMMCGEDMRSKGASVLVVSFLNKGKVASTDYYVTREKPEDLQPCILETP